MLEWFRRHFTGLKSEPRNLDSECRVAEDALLRGDFEHASIAYKNITEGWPSLAFAYSRRGRALLQLGRQAEAAIEFDRALQADAGDPEALYYKGIHAKNLDLDVEAIHFFERAFASPTPHMEAGLKLADANLMRGASSAALDIYQRVLDIDQNNAEARFGYGQAAMLLGREADAMDAFHRAFASPRPHMEAGIKLADANLMRGTPSIALDLYQRVLDIDRNNVEASFGYGQAAMLLGRDADAMMAFRHALTIKPDLVPAKATTLFEHLFQTISARRPRTTRPLICIPIVLDYYRSWLGGQSYLVNFARIMSSLPKCQRPRIVVVAILDNERDANGLRSVIDSLFKTEAVIGIVNSKAESILSKPLLNRITKRGNDRTAAAGVRVQRLMSIVDWTFPILYPMWRVPAIPGPLFWIPDLQHRIWPSFFNKEEVAGRDRDMTALSLRATPIVFSSQAAQRDFNDHFPNQRCRTHVWHFVSQPDAAEEQAHDQCQTLQLPERFYYTPNQFWRHKDHITLFHALRRILDSGHNVTFVCTGSDLRAATDDYSKELLQFIEKLSLGQNLRLLGVLPRANQIDVMRRCCAVIQPSLFEGWSTVVEDARAVGRPIIASNISVHREQLGNNATFFAPGNADSLAAAVISLDPSLKPGPDPDREAAALLDLKNRTRKSAQDFLGILKREADFRA